MQSWKRRHPGRTLTESGFGLEYIDGKPTPTAAARAEMSKAIEGALELVLTLLESGERPPGVHPEPVSQALVRMIDDELGKSDRETEAQWAGAAGGGLAAGPAGRRPALTALRDRAVLLQGSGRLPKVRKR